MSFKISMHKKDDVPVLKIWGEIRKENLSKIRVKLELLKKANRKVAIDLSKTDYIDSYGLGVFVFLWHQLEEKNVEIVFINPNGFIKELLAETSLSKVFKIIESEENL